MSKKSFLGLEQVIGLILVAIAIIIAIVIFAGLYSMFQGRPDQGSRESFKMLVQNIKTLKDGEEKTISYYLAKDQLLAGFNSNVNLMEFDVRPTDMLKEKTIINRPAECNPDNACLCLCEAKTNCEKKSNCESLKWKEGSKETQINIIEVEEAKPENSNNVGDANLYLLGALYYSPTRDQLFGVRKLTLKKAGGKLIIIPEPHK